jgi:hypothetical protein
MRCLFENDEKQQRGRIVTYTERFQNEQKKSVQQS